LACGGNVVKTLKTRSMPSKFDHLKATMSERNPKMKTLFFITEHYMGALNKIFDDRDVTITPLQEFHFQSFFEKLKEQNRTNKEFSFEEKISVTSMYFIVRHTWEYEGRDRKLKTGQHLHDACPTKFIDPRTMGVPDIMRELQYM
jgi:hypothetical protein